jgi:acetylornithine/N-succinyldiaminopimelate aminotransferase
MTPGSHGTTFGGNPLAMAVGNAVLDVVLAPGFLERVRDIGLRLKQKLAGLADAHPTLIETIRGDGLMMGLKCRQTNTVLVAAAREAGLLVGTAGDNVVRLLPPLIVTEAEVDEAISRLDAAMSALERRDAAA